MKNIENTFIWVVWEYDDGIVPQKEAWSICATKKIALTEKTRAQKNNPTFKYETEQFILQTK